MLTHMMFGFCLISVAFAVVELLQIIKHEKKTNARVFHATAVEQTLYYS